ncbi:hypothetical protein F5879DRAFT_17956 [Lentinula edodes]|nr:hypothetical protein F5879DRAFT_17956 [Lentinula edodes]
MLTRICLVQFEETPVFLSFGGRQVVLTHRVRLGNNCNRCHNTAFNNVYVTSTALRNLVNILEGVHRSRCSLSVSSVVPIRNPPQRGNNSDIRVQNKENCLAYTRTIHGSWMRTQYFPWIRLSLHCSLTKRPSGELLVRQQERLRCFNRVPIQSSQAERSFTLIVSIGETPRAMLNTNDDRPCRLIRLAHIREHESFQAHRIRMQQKDSNVSRR